MEALVIGGSGSCWNANRIMMVFGQNKKFSVYFSDNAGKVWWVQSAAAVPEYNPEEYEHLAVVVTKNTGTSTTIIVYINGSPITMSGLSGMDTPLSDTEQESYTSSAAPYIGNSSIGAPGSPTQTQGTFTTIHIKEFGLFNTPLDAANVDSIYNMDGDEYADHEWPNSLGIDLTQPVANYNSQNSLIGYWKLNEGVNTVGPSSTTANDHAHVGPTVTNGTITPGGNLPGQTRCFFV